MAVSFDYTNVNLYDVLDIPSDASEKEVIKAYRKKALQYHPDKNPDPSAVEIFHKLSKALEVLTDSAAKAAYDKILKARAAAELRTKQLDSKRRKLKEDLEAREQAGLTEEQQHAQETQCLQSEIERLRKEGSLLLEREQAFLRKELAKQDEKLYDNQDSNKPSRIKLKWKCSKTDATNGGYNESLLRNLFEKYSTVGTVLLSSKKNGSAVLEFESTSSKMDLVDSEQGLATCPLVVTWISGRPRPSSNTNSSTAEGPGAQSTQAGADVDAHPQSSSVSSSDFEALVLQRMRQAEERKYLGEMVSKDEAG